MQALEKEFAPLEAIDALAVPYPTHHLAGAKLKGFPLKPYALLQSKWVLQHLWRVLFDSEDRTGMLCGIRATGSIDTEG